MFHLLRPDDEAVEKPRPTYEPDVHVVRLAKKDGIELIAQYLDFKDREIPKKKFNVFVNRKRIYVYFDVKLPIPEKIPFKTIVRITKRIKKKYPEFLSVWSFWVLQSEYPGEDLKPLLKMLLLDGVKMICNSSLVATRRFEPGELIPSGKKGQVGDLEPWFMVYEPMTNVKPELNCHAEIELRTTREIVGGTPLYWMGFTGHPWDLLIECRLCGETAKTCPECKICSRCYE